jgi:hypothetical protein
MPKGGGKGPANKNDLAHIRLPGVSRGKICDIPDGVSSGQVIMLFEHTAEKQWSGASTSFGFWRYAQLAGWI